MARENKFSRDYLNSLIEESNMLHNKYREALRTRNKRMMTYWTNRLLKLEEPLRLEANKRLRAVLKQGIGEKMGLYDNILNYIREQQTMRDSDIRHLFLPQDADEANKNILFAAKFIRSASSTPEGVIKIIKRIREESPYYSNMDMSENDFIKFWKWRQLNPVHEFFKIFPPSPPELAGSVGTMVIDLWNSGEIQRKMLEDYFTEFQRFLDTQDEDWQEGIPPSILKQRLDKMYEETFHERRRF